MLLIKNLEKQACFLVKITLVMALANHSMYGMEYFKKKLSRSTSYQFVKENDKRFEIIPKVLVFFTKKYSIPYDIVGLIALFFLRNDTFLSRLSFSHVIFMLLKSPNFANLTDQFLNELIDHSIEMPIKLAKELGYVSLVKKLLPYDLTTLKKIKRACKKGNIKAIIKLAKNAERSQSILIIALNMAIELENIASINKLLKIKINLNAIDLQSKKTPLIASLKNETICKILIDANADINFPDYDGYTPLMYAATQNSSEKILKLLLENKADTTKYSHDNKNAVSCAVQAGYAANLKLLLKNKAPLNAELIDIILINLERGDTSKILKLLLKFNAHPDDKNIDGLAPLTIFIIDYNNKNDLFKNKLYKIIKILLEEGANPNITDRLGKTPLMYAIYKQDNQEIIKLLLQYEANPNAKNLKGQTALMLLAKFVGRGYLQNLSYLLTSQTIDITLTNKLNQNAFDIAFKHKNYNFVFALSLYKRGYDNARRTLPTINYSV